MPDGFEHPFEGTFGEIVAPVVTFVDHGERTTLNVLQTYPAASDATRGAPEGWKASLDQLGEVVAGLRAG